MATKQLNYEFIIPCNRSIMGAKNNFGQTSYEVRLNGQFVTTVLAKNIEEAKATFYKKQA